MQCADAGIEVAAVTMMLRYCHTCGFRTRFPRVAFHFSAWLKGFCAVAPPSHAKAFRTRCRSAQASAADLAHSLLNQFGFFRAKRKRRPFDRHSIRKTA